MDVWHQIKLHYIGLLVDHHQPELAESFFNSVTTKILHRAYFQNDFIFVRPAISTEYIEPRGAPTYRAVLPGARHAGRHRRADARRLRSARQLCRQAARCGARGARHPEPLPPGQAARQLPAAGAVGPVLPQQGRLRGRQDHERLHRDAVRAADPARPPRQVLHRRGAVRRGRPADAVQLCARLLHGRHGGALGLRAVPALAHAAQAARRDLQRARPCQAGQDAVLPRLPLRT